MVSAPCWVPTLGVWDLGRVKVKEAGRPFPEPRPRHCARHPRRGESWLGLLSLPLGMSTVLFPCRLYYSCLGVCPSLHDPPGPGSEGPPARQGLTLLRKPAARAQ